MSVNESKPRLRIKIACEECRKGKRKCDGQKPICSLCQRSGRVCIYVSEESRKRKYQDDDLIQNLQEQIETLKSALLDAKAFGGVDTALFHTSSTDDAAAPYEVVDTLEPVQTADVRSPLAMEELANLMLKMEVEERGEPSFTIAPRKNSTQYAHAEPREHDSSAGDFQAQQAFDYPLPGDRDHLIQCFMDNFNIYHHFLSQDEASDITTLGFNGKDIDALFRNYAVFAVASSFSPHPRLARVGPQYALTAEGLVLRCIKDRPSDLVVQGLALLSWRETMFGSPAMAYNYIAMATGQVLHLGLHVGGLVQSSLHNVPENLLYKRRARSFWAYFSVDRLVTSNLGMNCTMHWQRVKAPSFLSVVSDQPSVDEMAHERFCQLWHLWDSCMDQVYAFGWANLTRNEREALVLRSHEALTGFYRDSGEKLQARSEKMPDTLMWLQLSYNTALILIHRPLLNEASDSSAGRFALRSATTAAASISRIIRIYRKTRSFAISGPQVADYILTAAVIHLLNATAGKTQLGRQSANGLRSCLDALSEMQTRWAHRTEGAIRRIQELAYRWSVVWALPIQFSQPPVTNVDTVNSSGLESVYDNMGLIQNFDTLDDMATDGAMQALWQSSAFDLALYNDEGQPYFDWLFDGDTS